MSTNDKAQGKVSVTDAIDMMSESEKKRVEKDAATIRRSARGWLLRRHYMKLREATLLVQKSLRRKWQRREQNRRDEAGRKIERWVRSVKAAIVLQKQVRQEDRRTQAASTIQKWTRRQQKHQKPSSSQHSVYIFLPRMIRSRRLEWLMIKYLQE